MNNHFNLIATADTGGFEAPGYSSGVELPPLPVENEYEEIPLMSSGFDDTLLYVIVGVVVLIILILILFLIINSARKSIRKKNITVDKPDKREPADFEKNTVFDGTTGLSTPSDIKKCIKNFLNRTQNL